MALGPTALVVRIVSCFLCGIAAGLLVRFFYKDKGFFNFTGFAEPILLDWYHPVRHILAVCSPGGHDNLDIDTSYYLNNDEVGMLNVFEEYMVRVLTDAIVSGNVPETLEVFFDQEINQFMRTPQV
ncbi:hypothetical protein [Acutalibacter muris]|uniref:hypothetical protein n=1 Tax=Acutalibacter muris TaxID=1796620 RepID=UPI00080EFFC0